MNNQRRNGTEWESDQPIESRHSAILLTKVMRESGAFAKVRVVKQVWYVVQWKTHGEKLSSACKPVGEPKVSPRRSQERGTSNKSDLLRDECARNR